MTWQTLWEAYDVPRIWDAVHSEDDPLGWERACGLNRAAEMLTAHVEGLRARRELLAGAWQGPSAQAMLFRLDDLIAAAGSDAAAMTAAARGLHGIMTALASARKKIQPLAVRWDEVTSDWIPEYWDEIAAELNDEARTAMLVAAAEVRDYRQRLGAPEILDEVILAAPPALPGYTPATFAATGDGAAPAVMRSGAPATAPATVPAVNGQPVSMLPIPPGNPYAPDGGAYLLPGPGVGSYGFILPMSAHFWRVLHQPPPAIVPLTRTHVDPGPEALLRFHEWYAGIATPWRLGPISPFSRQA
jgi:hypothetical protein